MKIILALTMVIGFNVYAETTGEALGKAYQRWSVEQRAREAGVSEQEIARSRLYPQSIYVPQEEAAPPQVFIVEKPAPVAPPSKPINYEDLSRQIKEIAKKRE